MPFALDRKEAALARRVDDRWDESADMMRVVSCDTLDVLIGWMCCVLTDVRFAIQYLLSNQGAAQPSACSHARSRSPHY